MVKKGIIPALIIGALMTVFSSINSNAVEIGIDGDTAQSVVLSQQDAVLQNYSIEDIKATQSFLINVPYEGNGQIVDVNEDGVVNVFDLALLKCNYREIGNYYDLLYKMIEENEPKYSISTSSGEYFSNRVIVRTNKDYDFSSYDTKAILGNSEHKYILQFDSKEKAEECLSDLQSDSNVIYAELDDLINVPTEDSDSVPIEDSDEDSIDLESEIESYSWGAYSIEATKLADHIKKNYNSSVTVAVVDSGVAKHDFLNSRVLNSGYDIANNDNDPSDDSIGHGTHVSGTIVDCTPNLNINILPVKVFNGRSAKDSIISAGIKYAREMGVDVINLSLGGSVSSDIDYEVKMAVQNGITVVVAAGNEKQDTCYVSPAHNSECIVVSSINSSMTRADSSNFGQSVDVCAPGVNIKSSVPGGGFDYMSGTSMATPHISAAAAMIKCLDPAASPAQVESTLISTCKDLGSPGYDVYYGHGLPKLSNLIRSSVNPSISLSAKNATLYKGQKYTLSASVTPGDVYVNWTTSNSSVATVNNGVVTANSEGTATITAFFTYNGTNYSSTCSITVKKPGITISESSRTVYQTNIFDLNATATPSNQIISWSTSNSNVATVSNGRVTAVNPGTATITASVTCYGETYSASCNVTVKEVSVKLDQTSKTVYQTDEFVLTATATPPGQMINWTSSNSNIAEVSNGKVVAIDPGEATITASFIYGGKTFSASCKVTVKKVSIELNIHSKSLVIGDVSTLTAITSPTGLAVTWESTNNMIASVSNGKINTTASGNVTISAIMTYNGKEYSDTCNVTVVEPSVKINFSQVKISKNETFKLSGETIPVGQKITWKSEDPNICSIDSTGVVTGKSIGNTMVYATITYGGASYKASCNVIVGEPKVTLNKTSMTMYVSDTQSLIASVIAVDGVDISSETKSDIIWSSSDSSIITVDSNGSVKGIAVGTATITAKYSFCGISYTASCKVTVDGKPGISLNKSLLSMYIGDTSTLIETVTPANSTVTWSSSNSRVASVNSNGKVSAISNGSATITASIRYNGVTYFSDCLVTVTKPTITLSSSNGTIYQGDSISISATTKPSGYSIIWSSSNTKVATVSNGKITGRSAGNATITAKFTYAGNTYSATYSITVKAISLTLSSYSGSSNTDVYNLSLYTNNTFGFKVSLPSTSHTPSSGKISWSVVNGNGYINGSNLVIRQPGSCTARCTYSYNGYSVSKDFTYSISTYKITGGNNNIRSGPNSNYSLLGKIPGNVTVSISELYMNGDVNSGNLWGKIYYNGISGWIIISQW